MAGKILGAPERSRTASSSLPMTCFTIKRQGQHIPDVYVALLNFGAETHIREYADERISPARSALLFNSK